MRETIKILLADRYPIIAEGLEYLISLEDGMEVIGKATNGSDVLRFLKSRIVDIVIMSISMPELNGLDTAEILKNTNPKVKIIFLTTFDNEDFVRRAERIGVEGYLLREEESATIIKTIRAVYNGNIKYRVNNYDLNSNTVVKISNLTLKETQIFKLVIEGKTSKKIADELEISVKTVQCHRYNIRNKLRVKTPIDMLKIALQYRVIDFNILG